MDDDARSLRRHPRPTGAVAHELEESTVLALWLTAWLRGEVGPDDTRDAVVAEDAAHDVVLPDEQHTTPLVLALGRLRGLGAAHASLALPEAGDPLGLAGPPSFNADALEAGQAVLVHRAPGPGPAAYGLVPRRAGAGVVWAATAVAGPPPTEGVPAAEHGLRRALSSAADRLVDLEVARWRPEVADELLELRRPMVLPLPPALPGRTQALVALATRCRRIVALALEDDGNAVTAAETSARREALLPLDAAARRGLVAACDGAARG